MEYYDVEKFVKRIGALEQQLRDMESTIKRGITGKVNRSKTLSEDAKKEVLDYIWERK